MNYTATYSPDDNKLRLYASSRLDPETYAKVKAAGFKWAPKQELFVSPMWTPSREDLLIELAGSVDDEDKSLVERAEERADRFEDYSDNRASDAERARKAVSAIADNIPFGQPILVGHHSEKHARRDAAKIENGMRKAVKMWEQSGYWKDRAAGAIRSAKYKERPDVRARRIKGLESELRKLQKMTEQATTFNCAWTSIKEGANNGHERAMQIANYDHISRSFPLADFPRDPPASQYEGPMGLWSALDGNVITWQQAKAISLEAHMKGNDIRARWIAHTENRIAYERAMLAEAGGTVAERTGPEKGGACKCWASHRGGWSYIQKVNKVTVTVLDNWGNGGGNFTRNIPFDKLVAVMTAAEVKTARDAGLLTESGDNTGFFLLTEPTPKPTKAPEPKPEAEAFAALKQTLKTGVKIVTAPQLFPTPPDLAARMVEIAGVEPGQRVLEPSAGTGRLVDALDAVPGAKVVAVELSIALADNLRLRSNTKHEIRCADFLELNDELGTFDRILMNPPFENGADIKHIKHAAGMLKPGGRLVAICANGPRQREQLQPLAADWEDLPAGTFKDSGTGVSTAMLVIEA